MAFVYKSNRDLDFASKQNKIIGPGQYISH